MSVGRSGAVDRFDRPVDIVVGMGVAYNERGSEYSASDELLHEQGAIRLGWQVVRSLRGEYQIARATEHLQVVLYSMAPSGVFYAPLQSFAATVECFDYRFVLIDAHRGDARDERMRLGTVRRGEEKDSLLDVPESAALHHLAFPGEGGKRKPVGDCLPKS